MPERPLLRMPTPERRTPPSRLPPRDPVQAADRHRQAGRVGPKFERLERSLSMPETLVELRDDPSAIVPERALVFEVASDIVDFYQAVRGVPGLEFLAEDEGEAAPDDDFFIPDGQGQPRTDKMVPRRFYFTIPNEAALRELVSLWRRYQEGEELGRGRTAWRNVFGHLADVRPWGPRDRLTQDAVMDWEERIRAHPDQSVRFEVEFWYRDNGPRRERSEISFLQRLQDANGRLIARAMIDPIRYHAALVEVSPRVISGLLTDPTMGLATSDDVMVLRPQSLVTGPIEGDLEDASPEVGPSMEGSLRPPVAALLDGLPMAGHERLAGRVDIDDPDDFSDLYGSATEQRHGTAMASLILHGDLNAPNPSAPVRHKLYVRPVLYPHPDGPESTCEKIPSDRLGVDLIWRSFVRMYEGEGGDEPTAPSVRVVNMSLGDVKRRFAGVMSPWARLTDYVAWRYGILILISSGNITDEIPVEDVDTWTDFENAPSEERQEIMLKGILRQRANRKLLSPSESINSLTIGAAHADHIAPNGQGVLAIDPYCSRHLPNPSSALGLGFRRGVKPEILFPGGAEQVRSNSTMAPIWVRPVVQPARYFGIGVASPGPAGEVDRKLNMSGTSVATALATHSALKILEGLEDIPNDPVHPSIDPSFYAVILKALLVHSSRWDETTANSLKAVINNNGGMHWEHEREELARFIGFGCSDISRVIECAENRATLIGWNTINAKQTDHFKVPLPLELEGMAGFRAVSVTIGWLTPVTLSHRMYRLAKFEAGPGGDGEFSLGVTNSRQQPSHNAVGRGTVYHRRWEGSEAAAFVDDGHLLLDVTCSPAAGGIDEAIPYAVALTLEVGVDVAVPIYERIRQRLRETVRVST